MCVWAQLEAPDALCHRARANIHPQAVLALPGARLGMCRTGMDGMKGPGTTVRGSNPTTTACGSERHRPGAQTGSLSPPSTSQDVLPSSRVSLLKGMPCEPQGNPRLSDTQHSLSLLLTPLGFSRSHSELWLANLGSCLDYTSLISESYWAKTSQKLVWWQDRPRDREENPAGFMGISAEQIEGNAVRRVLN